MTNHAIYNRFAVVVLLISAAVLGATIQRDMSSSQTRCAPQPIAHHAGGANHTNHAHTN